MTAAGGCEGGIVWLLDGGSVIINDVFQNVLVFHATVMIGGSAVAFHNNTGSFVIMF